MNRQLFRSGILPFSSETYRAGRGCCVSYLERYLCVGFFFSKKYVPSLFNHAYIHIAELHIRIWFVVHDSIINWKFSKCQILCHEQLFAESG